MYPSRRERLRTAAIEEIKATAWQQIAERGAAALSLREIARRMGMTAPAIYRYYPDRDALVTALIIDAFTSFAEAMETARDVLPPGDHMGRFRAIATAYRRWAVTNPQKYFLIFVTPIPGYRFDDTQAGPHGQRSFTVLLDVLGKAYLAGKLSVAPQYAALPSGLQQYLDNICRMGGVPYPPVIFNLALAAWAKIHGMISLELHGIVDGMLGGNQEAFFQHDIDECIRQLELVSE